MKNKGLSQEDFNVNEDLNDTCSSKNDFVQEEKNLEMDNV